MTSNPTQPFDSAAGKEALERHKAAISEDWGPPFNAPLVELAEWQSIFGAWKATADLADAGASSPASQFTAQTAVTGDEADAVWKRLPASNVSAVDDPMNKVEALQAQFRPGTHPSGVPASALSATTADTRPRDKPETIFVPGLDLTSPTIGNKFVKVDKRGDPVIERSFVSSRKTMSGHTKHVSTMKEKRNIPPEFADHQPMEIEWVSVLVEYRDPDKYKSWASYRLKSGEQTMALMTVDSEGQEQVTEGFVMPKLQAPCQILGEQSEAASATTV